MRQSRVKVGRQRTKWVRNPVGTRAGFVGFSEDQRAPESVRRANERRVRGYIGSYRKSCAEQSSFLVVRTGAQSAVKRAVSDVVRKTRSGVVKSGGTARLVGR